MSMGYEEVSARLHKIQDLYAKGIITTKEKLGLLLALKEELKKVKNNA